MSRAALANRRTWALFLLGSAVLIALLAWLSAAGLRAERQRRSAASATAHEAKLRAAIERMESWLDPVLAREEGRHQSDYLSYRAPRRAFSRSLERLPEGSVLEPSPLLGFRADTVLLHASWSPETGLRSPQVPRGRERELALASGLPVEQLAVAEARLEELVARVDFETLASSLRNDEATPALPAPGAIDPPSCLNPDEQRESAAGPGLTEEAGFASVSPLEVRLLDPNRLALVRRAWSPEGRSLQLVVMDWPVLSTRLLEQVGEDLERPRFLPASSSHGLPFGALSLRFDAVEPPLGGLGWTPLRTRLAFAWLAGLACWAAVAVSLRAAISDAERRTRFAAAISHELRTPLTTLRLYSDLLADGTIEDDEARQEYLETIRAESGRLASLVENVLLHARIDRRNAPARQRLSVGELIDSIEPVLRRRADESGRPLEFSVRLDRGTRLEVDRAAVERVLFNLIDNACKHAAGAADPTLRLEVRRRGRHVDLQVSDHGPGVPRALAGAVFEAFRRGDENGSPGAGLGLTLSRALARELRGELSLVPCQAGACFRLSLRLGRG